MSKQVLIMVVLLLAITLRHLNHSGSNLACGWVHSLSYNLLLQNLKGFHSEFSLSEIVVAFQPSCHLDHGPREEGEWVLRV